MRSAALDLLSTLPPAFLVPYVHPRLYAIHEMSDEAGLPGPDGIVMPPALNLNSGIFKAHGLYLIDDGQVQFLWIGRDSVPALVQDVFGLSSIELVKPGKVLHLANFDANPRLLCRYWTTLSLRVSTQSWQNRETSFLEACIILIYTLS